MDEEMSKSTFDAAKFVCPPLRKFGTRTEIVNFPRRDTPKSQRKTAKIPTKPLSGPLRPRRKGKR